ncbi:hypothetical protein BASA62_003987 [Batrachochytrium salamandrivorans]|nr:hypothetical protein BASA62_003987 [Batrachochytrium salamandrivorans]
MADNGVCHMESVQGYGRSLIATTSIKPGQEILIENPYVAVADDMGLDRICSGCFRAAAQMQRCSACKVLQYCTQKCQRTDWPIHKMECTGFKALYPRIPPSFVRLIARILYKRNSNLKEYERIVGSLESHSDQRDTNSMTEIAALVHLVNEIVPKHMMLPSANDMIKLVCAVQVNAMTIERGTALYDRLSSTNHSCLPNACITFGLGGVARLSAMEKISPGEQITISYIDIFKRLKERQTQLKKQYYFDCLCRLCASGVNPTEDVYNTLVCPKSNETGCTGRWSFDSADSPCNVCGKLDQTARAQITERVRQAEANANTAKKLQYSDPLAAYVDASGALEILNNSVDSAHSLLLEVRTVLIELLIGKKDYLRVVELGDIQIKAWQHLRRTSMTLCGGKDGSEEGGISVLPMESSHSADVFQAAVWAMDSDLERVLEYGKRAARNLRMTHGEQHPTFMDVMEGLNDVSQELEARNSGVEFKEMKLV